MGDAHEHLGQAGWLSEDEAHRLLARAVELDATYSASTSVDDLRKAAGEAGIAPEAFAQAFGELTSGALEPVTIGKRLAARLGDYRSSAVLAGFVSAAMFTPGDAVGLTMLLGLGFCGAYEGLIALARLLGASPPRVPPSSGRHQLETRGEASQGRARDRTALRFMMLPRHLSGAAGWTSS